MAQIHFRSVTDPLSLGFTQELKQIQMGANGLVTTVDGTLTPLVFGKTGAMGRECQVFQKKLAKKLTKAQNHKKAK